MFSHKRVLILRIIFLGSYIFYGIASLQALAAKKSSSDEEKEDKKKGGDDSSSSEE